MLIDSTVSSRLNTASATLESNENVVEATVVSNAQTIIYLRAATSQGLGAIEGIERMKNENIK